MSESNIREMGQGVRDVNHSELEEMIEWSTEANLPLFIHGTFGIGKSQTVQEYGKKQGNKSDREFAYWNEISKDKKMDIYENPEDYWVFWDLRLAEEEPSNMKGIPDLENDIEATEWQPPIWAKVACKDGIKGMIFLDEVNQASPSVQSAFYKLILDRQVGEYTLAEDIKVLAAGNRAGKDQASVYEMDAPLRNRFLHLHLTIPSSGESGNWLDWATENDIHPYIISYIGSPAGSDHLFEFGDAQQDHKAIATPRSWAFASEILYSIEESKGNITPDDIRLGISSCVGEPIAQDFAGFIEKREEVPFDKFLQNPELAEELNERSVGIQRSVVTGLAAEYDADTDVLENLVEISLHIPEEMGTLMFHHCMRYHPQHFKKGIKDDDIVSKQLSDEMAEKYLKLLHEEDVLEE